MIAVKLLKKTGGPAKLARCLKQRQPEPMKHGEGSRHGPAVSVRSATYKGHEIEIRTSYEIKIDGKLLTGHMGVGDDGRVHYHPIPAYSSASMVDLIYAVVDAFPDDYPAVKKRKRSKTKKNAAKASAKRQARKGGH